ncbi:MAG TPA: TPM domain-containing protein [Deltaproteobacteria bacterium]|nr:TPM domain-containing protein [Deltaproteobacteria bacterium]
MRLLCVVLLVTGCGAGRGGSAFIDDEASIIPAQGEKRIHALCGKLLEDLRIHIYVKTLPGTGEDVDTAASALFDVHRLGARTDDERGLLFLVAPQQRQVRIEVGYGLEGIFPDSFVGSLERQQMVPFFSSGRVADGIEATVELLVTRALQHEGQGAPAGVRPASPASPHYSGGAGARADLPAERTRTYAPVQAADADRYRPQDSPAKAFEVYRQVLRDRVKDPGLPIYTEKTRTFLRQWLVTDAQQSHEASSLDRGIPFRIHSRGGLAVIRYPVEERSIPPYFFRKGTEGWMIDLASMSELIGFNHLNQWHFRTMPNEFMFAFPDAVFDKNGYPHRTGAGAER